MFHVHTLEGIISYIHIIIILFEIKVSPSCLPIIFSNYYVSPKYKQTTMYVLQSLNLNDRLCSWCFHLMEAHHKCSLKSLDAYSKYLAEFSSRMEN